MASFFKKKNAVNLEDMTDKTSNHKSTTTQLSFEQYKHTNYALWK